VKEGFVFCNMQSNLVMFVKGRALVGVFENRVGLLMNIFGSKKVEIRRGSRKLHDELHNSRFSVGIIKLTKSRTMGLA
jgi:hypothetical protein